MPPSAKRALKSSLEERTFDRVYLFHGDDDYLKEAKVREVIDRATDPATRDFNLDVLRAGDLDAGSLGVALDSLPMMAERRVVVVRDVTTLKKDARTVLAKYLARPAADTLLLLVAAAGTKPDAPLLDAATAIDFRPLTDGDVAKWVAHHATTLGVTIDEPAAELLCSATGNDLALLAGEIDKLRSYTNGAPIDAAAIEAIVGVRHGETLGDLLDLVAQRKSSDAVALLERVLAQPKTSGVSIVMALTTQTLAMGWLAAARERGLAQHQFERELYALLKENPSSLVGRPWGDAVKGWVHALRHWDTAAIDRAIALLVAADLALKDTRLSSEEQLLTSLLLSMTAGVSRRAAA
ncbi:MAG: DNA polymerase III subunit delta [Gemmatimonadaceae bacterium]